MKTYLIVTEETTAVQYMDAAGFTDAEIEEGNRTWGNRRILWVRVMETADNHEAMHDALKKAEDEGNVRRVECACDADTAQKMKLDRLKAINNRKNIAYVADTGEILISVPKPKAEKKPRKKHK